MKRQLCFFFIFLFTIASVHSQDKALSTIIKNVFLIDGTGNEATVRSVEISNGTITQIGNFKDFTITEKTTIVDGTAKYLIAGLIDSHVHLMMGGDENGQKQLLQNMLKTGVTTVQDLVGDARDLAFFSKQQKRGIIQAPEIYFAAMFTNADFMQKDFRMAMFPDGQQGQLPFLQAVDDNTDYKMAIARAHGTGATAIKLYAGLSKNSMENLSKEAHKLKMKVWSHAAQFPLTVQDILVSDIDVYCHAGLLAYTPKNVPSEYHEWFQNLYNNEHYQVFPDRLEIDLILNSMAKNNTILDATLLAWKGSEESFALATKIIKRAHALGVKITTGTDVPGFPTLEEIYLMVEVVGLSPKEALISSSKNGAEAIGIDKTHGTIEIGKVANLILLNDNPLENIRNIEKIEMILLNGKVLNFD